MNTQDPQRKTLASTILHLYQTGLYSDVTILVGPEKHAFNVHQMIIGGRSQVFMTMLKERWNETQNQPQIIELPTTSGPAFKAFMHYMYTDKYDYKLINEEIALEVLELAHLYDVPEMVDYFSNYLRHKINADNCLKIYKTSRLIDKNLSEESFKCFVKNICKTTENDQYLELDSETVKDILMLDQLNFEEIGLFKALQNWSKFNSINEQECDRSQSYPELLKLIRFPTMGMKTFADKVVPSNALLKDEVLQILLYFANPESNTCNYGTKQRYKEHKLNDVKVSESETGEPINLNKQFAQSLCSKYVTKPDPKPELRMKTSKPITLFGIRFYSFLFKKESQFSPSVPVQINGTNCQVKVTSQGEILHDKKQLYSCKDANTEYFFDTPLKLAPEKFYEIYVCLDTWMGFKFPSTENVLIKGGLKKNEIKGIAVENGIVTLDFSVLPRSETLLHSLIFSSGVENVPTCAVM